MLPNKKEILVMEDKKNNIKALVKSHNSSLITVGNTLDISKKIISQGNIVEQNHSKIKLIPFKKNGKWHLYDIVEKQFLKSTYKCFMRKREYLLCLDYNNNYSLFKEDKILCQFKDFTDSSRGWCPSFEISSSGQIILWYNIPTWGRKYISGWYPRIEGVLNLKGEIIDYEISKDDLELYENNEETSNIKIEDTLWRVNSDGLYFKSQQIINGKHFYELSVSKFHYGYAFVEDIIDVDPEFGVQKSDLGFIDVYGNYYWDKLNPTHEN